MNIEIERKNWDVETTLEIIKFLSKTVGGALPKKPHEDLNQIVSWTACCQTKEDRIFFEKTLKRTNQKIEKYFHKKDLKEMEEQTL